MNLSRIMTIQSNNTAVHRTCDKNNKMKSARINIFLLLVIMMGSANAYCQLTYVGSPAQKLSSLTNALIKLKQDTMYVPTQDGLFKKSVMSNDTLWIPAGFQGMKINDFVLIGQDSIV